VLPISEKTAAWAGQVRSRCQAAGLRAELDERPDKIGYKIRDAEVHKVPCMVVVGEKEQAAGAVSLRRHGKGDLGVVSLEELVTRLTTEVRERI